ncbi:putative NAD(P)H nitroreductase [Clostridium saccharobutylicum]|uniref:nitroreductase family protein n=1 Tax=Clostridium saccharobutylicum TaxID=169679 RepID=UPI00098BE8E3|nr:nitroreductase family protein [Clostridium saccharobutylicum]MBC2435317.1 NAD(P)H nitroreductase [Clostridium saccharobutylicum]NSB87418.1 nitroreductase [Clostridium saccharobutylicum]NYC28455.1 nitroreductase [Clostridium saccharobutylicum]OOM15648.1 putative NAD(P)H nitroreductase [Clostridium saccharobutylicum]
MEEFLNLINKRQSCRKYLDKHVEKEKLIKCIEAARLAPSACNSQPWHFVVVNNKELSPKVAMCLQDKVMNKFTTECPAFIIVVEEGGNLTSRTGGLIKQQDYRSVDIGIAAEHICLAATEQNLGTCILGWFDEKKLKKLLNISKLKRIRLAIAIGYAADDNLRRKIRKDINEIATFL